jgi:hypothetical protein
LHLVFGNQSYSPTDRIIKDNPFDLCGLKTRRDQYCGIIIPLDEPQSCQPKP